MSLPSTLQRFTVPALGFSGYWGVVRERGWFVIRIKGNKGEVGRGNMAYFTGAHVFRLDPDTDLHGRVVCHIQAALESQQVTHMDGPMKVDPVNGGGDHIGSGIPGGNNKGGIVNELHDDPAIDIAGWVDVVGHHDMGNNGSAKF